MNNFKLKGAVKKYSELYKTDPEATKEAILLDHEKEDAEVIIAELNGKPVKAPSLKWYDEFDARIQKREVRNKYTLQMQTIITGWILEKKKQPKSIEPHTAVYLNSFANGYDTLGVGSLLLPKDTAKTGDMISYEDWGKEQGKDLPNDINILLLN